MKKTILQTLEILNFSEKKQLTIIFFLTVIFNFLETLSISLVFPLVGNLTNSENKDQLLNFDFLNNIFSENDLSNIFMIFLFIFFIKLIFILFFLYQKTSFIQKLAANLSLRVLKKYVSQNLNFFYENNSSLLTRNIVQEISQLISGVIEQTLSLIIELILVLSLVCLAFYAEPLVTTIIFLVFFISFFIFYYVVTPKTKKWGQETLKLRGNILKKLNEIFSSIKFIKVTNKEFFFFKDIKKNFLENARITILYEFTKNFPRPFFEFLLVILVVVIVQFKMYFTEINDYSGILPLLGLYAAIAFRIVPSFSRILVHLNNIKFSKASVDVIYNEAKLKDKIQLFSTNNNNFDFQNVEFKNVDFAYKNKENVFEDINFTINKNEFIAIVGDSGIGKTTLIDLLAGLVEPTKGEILLNGKKLKTENKNDMTSVIGYIPQNYNFLDDTIEKNIAFAEENVNRDKIKKSLIQANLIDFVDGLPGKYEEKIGEQGILLSGGQKQRLAIARSLYLDAQILIMDESTSNLDKKTEAKIFEEFMKLKNLKTLIVITHKMLNYQYFDKIISIKNKKINIQKGNAS
jgi:ABC-type bacteriocin/lantibiotic exporter with double-glycine peptidase domain